MTENNNTSNLNNRPNGVNSVSNAPRIPGNMPQRPNYPAKASNITPRQVNNTNLYQANRQTASERFERGSKSLAHMNGGTTGTELYKANRLPQEEVLRKQVGGVILDENLIKNANSHNLNNKSNQKTTIIVILSIMLVLSLMYLTFAIVGYFKNNKKANCKYHLTSDVDAHWMIDNDTETEFVISNGLATGKIYEIKSTLIIDSDDKVNIKITISVMLDGKEISIAGLDGESANLIRESENEWSYIGGYQGVGELHLFNGIDFSGAPQNINSNNITIDIHAIITRE